MSTFYLQTELMIEQQSLFLLHLQLPIGVVVASAIEVLQVMPRSKFYPDVGYVGRQVRSIDSQHSLDHLLSIAVADD